MQWAKQKQAGFTIVELLIVVVVIAILAAITIVSYNGITNRTKDSRLQGEVASISKKLEAYKFQTSTNETYPLDLSTAGINVPSERISYQYDPSNNYCLNGKDQPSSFSATSRSGGVKPGACAINMAPNPSIEVNLSGYARNNGGSTVDRSTARAYIGSGSLLVTGTGVSSGYNGANFGIQLEANKTYTLSAWVYINSAYGAGVAATTNCLGTPVKQGNMVSAVGVWTRTSVSFTPTSSGAGCFYIISSSAALATTGSFHIDGVMVTETTEPVTYGDGSVDGWSWNGAENASTSMGGI